MGPLETQFVHVWEQRCIFLQQNNLEFQYLSSTGTREKKFGMIFNSLFFLPVRSWSIPIPAHH